MVSLTGHGLNIVKESNVCLTFDGLKHETAFLVTSDLGVDSMLVAWHDLQPLEIMSPNFPARNFGCGRKRAGFRHHEGIPECI